MCAVVMKRVAFSAVFNLGTFEKRNIIYTYVSRNELEHLAGCRHSDGPPSCVNAQVP